MGTGTTVGKGRRDAGRLCILGWERQAFLPGWQGSSVPWPLTPPTLCPLQTAISSFQSPRTLALAREVWVAKLGDRPQGCCQGQKLKVQNPGSAELTPVVLWTKITEMDLPTCLFAQIITLISTDTALYLFTAHSHSLPPLNLGRRLWGCMAGDGAVSTRSVAAQMSKCGC